MLTNNVMVLLSTYNGQEYLQAQLDSIYKQSYPNISLLVRDDGSTDATYDMLCSERLNKHLDLLDGRENLGVADSFFVLLQQAAASSAQFFAFCDQDDVWNSKKIERAVDALKGSSNMPAMYCARLELVDEDLNHIKLTHIPKKIGFGNALFENIATGCTVVLNRKALELICKTPPDDVFMHDWWCYLAISCFGVVIYDDTPVVKYRQHSNNVVGAPVSALDGIRRKFRRAVSGDHHITRQAANFLDIYGDNLSAPKKALLTKLVSSRRSFSIRVGIFLSRDLWRQKIVDDILFKFMVLLGFL
jgi:glycosyltransferase involved in cell wall biosynthesis